MALVFALTRQPTWKATQGLIVRDQTCQRSNRGEFESLDAMKTAQDTILEIARNRTLVENALKAVGPPEKRRSTDAWPNQDEIDGTLDGIIVSATKGAEFGKTEVIYLNVVANNKQRATLPYNEHSPTVSSQDPTILAISLDGSRQLGFPVLVIGLRHSTTTTAAMLMPKTTVDEDH